MNCTRRPAEVNRQAGIDRYRGRELEKRGDERPADVAVGASVGRGLFGSGFPALEEFFEEFDDIVDHVGVFFHIGFGEMTYHENIKLSQAQGEFSAIFQVEDGVEFVDNILGLVDIVALAGMILLIELFYRKAKKLDGTFIEHDNEL
jgi:hypothetical protein